MCMSSPKMPEPLPLTPPPPPPPPPPTVTASTVGAPEKRTGTSGVRKKGTKRLTVSRRPTMSLQGGQAGIQMPS